MAASCPSTYGKNEQNHMVYFSYTQSTIILINYIIVIPPEVYKQCERNKQKILLPNRKQGNTGKIKDAQKGNLSTQKQRIEIRELAMNNEDSKGRQNTFG